jgi:cytoplasmic tRNA 2-thiolation protein 1
MASLCGVCRVREAFFYRAYSGERLCRRCFRRSVEDKVRATVSRYDMLRFDDRIAVAVSGGKDSLSLLHILEKFERRQPKASLVAITVDEGIRGYRDEALRLAADACKKLDVEHHVVSFRRLFGITLDDIVKRRNEKPSGQATACAYCGVLRRKALNLAARNVEADKLATAHTLDDEVQTILLNLFHGDVWRLSKEKPMTDEVHPKLVRRIKPFCEVLETESTLYAYTRKIAFQSRPCPYAPEAFRTDIRTLLNRVEQKHPGTKCTIFSSVERLRPVIEEAATWEALNECVECGEPTVGKTCRACEMLKALE